MRSLFVVFFSFVLALLIVTGCKKTETNSSVHYLSASISGGGTIYSTDTFLTASKDVNGRPTSIGISANTASGAKVFLQVFPFTGVGSFTFNSDIFTYALYYRALNVDPIISAHGTVNFTEVSPRLIGTFNFTCIDSTVVTGSFNLLAP